MVETSTKKRKKSVSEGDVPAKKSKKEKHGKKDLKGKGREAEFHVLKTSLVLSVPPVFANNPRAGVEEMLDSMVMRYIPALHGVVLAHSNIQFLSNKATLIGECPFLVCKVEFDATIWCPHVGMQLVGKINLCSPDHVSLLLHRTFNVSIPRHHIPQHQWIFEYGPAENDPEFGPDAHGGSEEEGQNSRQHGDSNGKWVHHLTHAKLGGTDGYLEFTVIGVTIANEMLSLIGSIQPDPFSSEHAPATGKGRLAESDIEELERNAEDIEDDEIESDYDTFKLLSKESNLVAAAEAQRRHDSGRKEKRRKRKAEHTGGRQKHVK